MLPLPVTIILLLPHVVKPFNQFPSMKPKIETAQERAPADEPSTNKQDAHGFLIWLLLVPIRVTCGTICEHAVIAIFPALFVS